MESCLCRRAEQSGHWQLISDAHLRFASVDTYETHGTALGRRDTHPDAPTQTLITHDETHGWVVDAGAVTLRRFQACDIITTIADSL